MEVGAGLGIGWEIRSRGVYLGFEESGGLGSVGWGGGEGRA